MSECGRPARASFKPQAPRRKAAGKAAADDPVLQTLWDLIAMIPRGRVSTYGDIARAAGLVRSARRTAYALRMAPRSLHLPWHRVLGAGGRIVFPQTSPHYHEQARRLRAEGVTVKDGRVAQEAITRLDEL